MSRNLSEPELTNQNENQTTTQQTPTNFQPRTPLTAIPDPSQSDRSLDPHPDPTKTARFHHNMPRSSRAHPEPCTPARRGLVASGGSRRASSVYSAGKGSNVNLNLSLSLNSADGPSVGVQHFELQENQAFWTNRNVQVLIRIRPLSSMERVSQGYGSCLKQESAQSLVWLGHPETRFTFDHVACETISQEKLFKVAGVPMVENCMYGYNSCIFAYGQTGSGKTYTMMGEIHDLEDDLTESCGITPRIFEYLFRRIREEEEKRKDEKLTYSCKCSFLEIYNEQITDLLEPSSTNLQLREDLKKGVYVENLTEYNVRTVNDVANLLLKGAASRKMAATHTNSESSRSHSVFTCIIESRWERDSMTHFRFARLNLVDLAGSERQKCSGAEGERLKEAANINKSLSTLGLVIMSLVDLAQGKHRHIPYRDSRLTFLLQDSLGGNSKTMIIANVSPSICSMNETLSTLKFAQRAKLIQNNAKVNEDASGNVSVMQKEIHQLKDQLSFLLDHCELSTLLPNCNPNSDHSGLQDLFKDCDYLRSKSNSETKSGWKKTLNSAESILIGSLRREKLADEALQRLKADIEQMNRLIGQKEEDVRQTKMMLRFREEKIKRLESLTEGTISSENYLVDENKALLEEIQLLRAKIDRNPELTRFALENMRLLEQLHQFQYYSEQGERETLLAEVTELRSELLNMLEGRCTVCTGIDCQVENNSLMNDSGDEMTSSTQADEAPEHKLKSVNGAHPKDSRGDWMDARLVIEAMESEQLRLMKELQDLQEENYKYKEIFGEKCVVNRKAYCEPASNSDAFDETQERSLLTGDISKTNNIALQSRLDILTVELEKLRLVNRQYQEDHASQISHQHQVEIVCEQVELETARTIIHLQDEIAALQSELNERILHLTQENTRLSENIASKENDMRALREEWEWATLELTRFLLDSSRYIKDASRHVDSIVSSFPRDNDSIIKNVKRAARACIEKEETLLLLQRNLEHAQNMAADMESKISTLKGATLAMNIQQEDEDVRLSTLVNEKSDVVQVLEKRLRCRAEQVVEAEKRAYAAYLIIKWIYDTEKISKPNRSNSEVPSSELLLHSEVSSSKTSKTMIKAHVLVSQETDTQVEQAKIMLFDSVNAVKDTGRHMTSLQTEILGTFSGCTALVQKLVGIIYNLKTKFDSIKQSTFESFGLQSLKARDSLECGNQLCQVRSELADIDGMLMSLGECINRRVDMYKDQLKDEESFDADTWFADYSTSDSDSSSESSLSAKLDEASDTCSYPLIHINLGSNSVRQFNSHDPENLTEPKEISGQDRAMANYIKKEISRSSDCLRKVYVQLNRILDDLSVEIYFHTQDMVERLKPDPEIKLEKVEACSKYTREIVADEDADSVNSFFSRCMEAHTSIKEADNMLNELLKANENLKRMNNLWKQAGEKLMVQRNTLMKEVAQMKSSLHKKERENQLLQEESHAFSCELVAALSSLEEDISQMQREVEEGFRFVCSDVVLLGREILYFLDKTQSLFEDIFSEFMAKEFASFVLYQCHMEELIKKTDNLMVQPGVHISQKPNFFSSLSNLKHNFVDSKFETMTSSEFCLAQFDRNQMVNQIEEQKPVILHDIRCSDSLALQNELQRKELLLQGLLFDFKMLQETVSIKKDIKDETEKLSFDLAQARHEIDMKNNQLDGLLSQQKILHNCLADTEEFLAKSNSELDQAKEEIVSLTDQNTEYRVLLKELYLKNSENEKQLEEKKQVVQSLEDEILDLTHALEQKTLMSIQNGGDVLQKVTGERDQLYIEVQSLTDRLEMALALADENEAIGVEARQHSEESKLRAEQKEEEVKVLERSIEELECTINMMEKKVYEMEAEVERHRLIRDSSNEEFQAWRERLSIVENLEEKIEQADQISWQQHETLNELLGARNRIKHLEEENEEHKNEIKQYKDYISELLLHAEAQASQYQCKYKSLEAMFHGVKIDAANSTATAATSNKVERSSVRTRGSSSPFKCISSLVQQMNLEKGQELSMARIRIEELEALAATQKKEICMMNTRLAAAESMTHDVIRDLLGIKLDMTNYANLVDQQHVQKLVEAAHHYTEELIAKEQDIQLLRKHVDGLIEERKSYKSDIDRREADLLAAEVTVEQLRERNQLLSAQNEMLKMDKTNLKRRVAELDETVKTILGKTVIQKGRWISPKKETGSLKLDVDLRLTHSEKLLSRLNEEIVHYTNPSESHHHSNTGRPAWK